MKTKRKNWMVASVALGLVMGLILAIPLVVEEVAPAPAQTPERGTAAQIRSDPEGERNPQAVVLARGDGKESGIEDGPGAQIAALLSQPHDLSDPAAHAEFVAELQRLEGLQSEATRAKSEQRGLALLTPHGSVLTGFDGEVPLYEIPHNAGVATSIGTDLVREMAPRFPDGDHYQIGLWDVYYGATVAHVEMPKITLQDDAVEGGVHASHVAGTLTASGIDPQAKGMAPQAQVWSFSSASVLSEIAANAAQNAGDGGKLFVSVHPYGVASGWEYDGAEWHGSFSNDGNNANDVPIYLGQYGSSASSWDGTVANFPYHLIVKSAGNHNDDNAPDPDAIWYLNGSAGFSYDPASHPKSDGGHYNPSGYGTIDSRASAKNVLTVGSTSAAVTDGGRDPGAAVLSLFSSTGPTDDGRIKPDLVAAGENVYSVDGSTAGGYMTASGTSMSSAAVAGSAVLLQEIHGDYTGNAMQASTLKGLLIHTADDLELPGPDYRTGWGLANVQAAAALLDDDDASAPLDRLVEAELSFEDRQDYYVVSVDGTGPVRVTLCWTDLAGNWTSSHDSRSRRLVNDLNVRLVSLDGTTTHYPYVMPYSFTWAQDDLDTPAMNGVNTIDNVEQIHVEAPAPGLYRIEVDYAGSLQGNEQDYSLLVTGTHLGVEGVEVVNSVADQGFLALDSTPVNVANATSVFSGTGHQYDISWSQEGILTATVDASGAVLVTPTLTGYGRVDLTLSATDSTGGVAGTSFSISLRSEIVRVNSSTLAPAAEQNGTSWELAYGKLQDALDAALSGQEIWVANGVYYPDERNAGDSNNYSESFTIPNGVRLYGGFTGSETVRWERDVTSEATILSGDLFQDDFQQPIVSSLAPNPGDWNNCYHVVRIPNGATARLDGFVVTAGRNTELLGGDGAGIWVQATANATIANCLITGNHADGKGGGLASDDGFVNAVKCRFLGNKAGSGGGAISSTSSTQVESMMIFNCEVRGNQASDGGGLFIDRGDVWIMNSLFSGNTGLFGGGGIHQNQGWFLMVNSTMTGHSTLGLGGAIQVAASSGQPEIYNCIIWKNSAGGSEYSTNATAYGSTKARRPYYEHCLVANSGGSANWNSQVGWDGWNNIDIDPGFAEAIEPTSAPTLAGDFRLTPNSPALNTANSNNLLADQFDLDGDGDVGEAVPVDLAGNPRVGSATVDMGAYEFGDPNLLDADNDGLSDAFEAAHGGDLEPLSDDDGDGLTAVAEFVHGLDPDQPLDEPVSEYAPMDYLGSQYLCMTYRVNPDALNFVNLTVERRADLRSPLGWQESQTIVMSTVQSTTHPGLLEVTVRSLVPFGQDGMEFLRIRHDVIPSGNQTIPQSDPQGSTSVSGWNVWGP